MQKLLVLMMVLVMMLSMAACGAPAADEETGAEAGTEEKESVKVGDVLSKPEVSFGNGHDSLCVSYSIFDEKGEIVETPVISLVNRSDDTYVFYLTDLLHTEEVIFDVSDEEIEKYYKTVASERYTKETQKSQEALREELDAAFESLELLGAGTFDEETKFVKGEDEKYALTGEAFRYTVQNGESEMEILVDQETGVWVDVRMDGAKCSYVTQIKTTDVTLPDYE